MSNLANLLKMGRCEWGVANRTCTVTLLSGRRLDWVWEPAFKVFVLVGSHEC